MNKIVMMIKIYFRRLWLALCGKAVHCRFSRFSRPDESDDKIIFWIVNDSNFTPIAALPMGIEDRKRLINEWHKDPDDRAKVEYLLPRIRDHIVVYIFRVLRAIAGQPAICDKLNIYWPVDEVDGSIEFTLKNVVIAEIRMSNRGGEMLMSQIEWA